ncbi:5,5'-dehydrodivanillate O-demethylase [Paraburkholderia sp. RAU6.4a]|uniref:Rieske 2Fe-2S domain-containing protein n=1 Tax=Paraburkholderia sp. RAU6.4a TaxID=2991067 RepID=UPI003D1D9CDB
MNVDNLISTGRETLGGRYMRMFWQPVSLLEDLKAGQAKPLRIMGDDYTIYRGESGSVYLTAQRCAHRGTQLSAGWVEGETIRCRYHGWRYDETGQCVEQPGEGNRPFCSKVKLRSWPVRVFQGLVFAFLGDGEPPAFPTFTELDANALVETYVYTRRCNFFSGVDNALDAIHVSYTHKQVFHKILDIPDLSVEEIAEGVVLFEDRHNGEIRISEWLAPNILRVKTPFGEEQVEGEWIDYWVWRVPIDDGSHYSFALTHVHVEGDARQQYLERRRHVRSLPVPPVDDLAKEVLRGALTLEEARAHMGEHDPYYDIILEDHVALEGQGVAPDRAKEHLGRADVGVIAVRKRWLADLDLISNGTTPHVWSYAPRSRITAGV